MEAGAVSTDQNAQDDEQREEHDENADNLCPSWHSVHTGVGLWVGHEE